MRKRMKEPAFGEKLAPVLNDIENAILDHRDMFPGEPCSYSDEAFRSAISIFLDVAVDKMWEYHERLDLPQGARERAAKQFLDEFRMLVFRYCDIATEKLLK